MVGPEPRDDAARVRRALAIVFALAISLYAASERRWWAGEVVAGRVPGQGPFLQGDASSFYRLARELPFPCLTLERAPGILVLGRAALAASGDLSVEPSDRAGTLANHVVLRRVSIGLGLLALAAIVAAGLAIGGRATAGIAAALWASNLWAIRYGVDFLREDLAGALNLSMVVLYLVHARGPTTRRREVAIAVALAALGGLAAYVREDELVVVLLLSLAYLAAKIVFRKVERRDVVLLVAVNAGAWLLFTPYLAYNQREAGDPFHSMSQHATFWRNHEFAGQEGFPTRAEVVADSYTGEPITSFEYVFGLHTPAEVAARYARGYWVALTHFVPRIAVFDVLRQPAEIPFLAWLVPLGAVLAVATRREQGLFFALAGLACLFPFAFVLPLDIVLTVEVPEVPPGVEPRFAMPIVPFAFLLAAFAVDRAISVLRERIGGSRRD